MPTARTVDHYLALREECHDYEMPTEPELTGNICEQILRYEHRFAQHGAIPVVRDEAALSRGINLFQEILSAYSICSMTDDLLSQLDRRSVNRTTQTRRTIVIGISLDQLHSVIASRLSDPRPTNHVADTLTQQDICDRHFDCDTYSAIVLGVADHYDLPMAGVHRPGHLFVRYESPWYRANFDQGSVGMSDEVYIDGSFSTSVGPISSRALESSSYMRSMSLDEGRRELFAHYLLLCAVSLVDNQEYSAALDLADICIGWNPHHPITYYTRAQALVGLGYFKEAVSDVMRMAQLDPGLTIDGNLGYNIHQGLLLRALDLPISRDD